LFFAIELIAIVICVYILPRPLPSALQQVIPLKKSDSHGKMFVHVFSY